jgi:hypothetical protein
MIFSAIVLTCVVYDHVQAAIVRSVMICALTCIVVPYLRPMLLTFLAVKIFVVENFDPSKYS